MDRNGVALVTAGSGDEVTELNSIGITGIRQELLRLLQIEGDGVLQGVSSGSRGSIVGVDVHIGGSAVAIADQLVDAVTVDGVHDGLTDQVILQNRASGRGLDVDAEGHDFVGLLLNAGELVGRLDVLPVGDGDDHVIDFAILQSGDSRGIILDHVPDDLIDLGPAAVVILESNSTPRGLGIVVVFIPHVGASTSLIGDLTKVVALFGNFLLRQDLHLVKHVADGGEGLIHNDLNGVLINLLDVVQRTDVRGLLGAGLSEVIAEDNVISGHGLAIVELDVLSQGNNVLGGIVVGLDLLSQTQVVTALSLI